MMHLQSESRHLYITSLSNTAVKGSGEKKGNQEEGCAVSLLILVTGNRQMEVPALRPGLHWSSPVIRRGSSGPRVSERSIQSNGKLLFVILRHALSTGPGGDRTAELALP